MASGNEKTLCLGGPELSAGPENDVVCVFFRCSLLLCIPVSMSARRRQSLYKCIGPMTSTRAEVLAASMGLRTCRAEV